MRKIWGIIVLVLLLAMPAMAAASQHADMEVRTQQDGILSIRYPVVQLDNEQAAKKINAVLQAHVDKARAYVEQESDFEMQEFDVDFIVRYNDDGVLSLTMTDYMYTGGAHGMSYRKGYSFDLATGSLYSFDDLVHASQISRINSEIERQLAEAETPLLRPFTGIEEQPDFYLLPNDQIVIFYQLYSLAPYVAGFLDFPVSLH